MPEPLETDLRVLVRAESREGLREFLRLHSVDLSRGHPRAEADGALSIEALVAAGDLDRIRDGPWTVEVIEDASAAGAARQQEVGIGDRYAAGRAIPRGLGRKE